MNHLRHLIICLSAVIAILTAGCSGEDGTGEDHVVMSLGKKVSTIDPALAADFPSQSLCAAFYDTLIQYDYDAPGYRLEPAMLKEMPVLLDDGLTYRCTLRDDLYFQDGPWFSCRSDRKVTSRDVVFSLLRLADGRLNSPGYWIVRDTIRGIPAFREKTVAADPGDMSVYDDPVEGLEIVDDQTFLIKCSKREPRLFYLLAMPGSAVVSRRAADAEGNGIFSERPCGSGPYCMTEWKRDYSVEMARYPEYRHEVSGGKRLPSADRITCYLVRQDVSSWLMFLQGELDFYALGGEQFQALVNEKGELADALKERGIRLLRSPLLETSYIGMHFNDPVLGKNADLRAALSLAFDKEMRSIQSGGRFIPAYGAVPPGIDGALEDETGSFGRRNVELAKKYLAKAGYPGGIDPETGKPLVLTFDQAGTDTAFQQLAELMANDMRAIGIEIRANLNTRPRFQAKLSSGDMQLFRYSWCADYPDAENFLQLFYSGNAGGCNRVCFSDPEYDRMYETVRIMDDSPERTELYRKMGRYLQTRCPWIFESHTMSFVLHHSWLKQYRIHDFAFNRWKYLSAPADERTQTRRSFEPLPMSALR